MLAAEVVVGDVKRLHGLVVDPFFTEGIRQARITPVAHADRQVLPFYVASADLGRVGVAEDWDRLRAGYVRRAVPVLAFGVLGVHFDELREIHLVAQVGFDRRDVGLESVRGQLEGFFPMWRVGACP